VLVQMQWQLIPETTMHAFDINALLTMIRIKKHTERTWTNSGNGHKICFPNVKTINAAVPEKLTIKFFLALEEKQEVPSFSLLCDLTGTWTNEHIQLYYTSLICIAKYVFSIGSFGSCDLWLFLIVWPVMESLLIMW
jgi:hypothetical protein